MTAAVELTSFGSQNLNDGVNYNQLEVTDPGPVPILNLVPISNGAVHDPNATTTATLRPPDSISCEITVSATTDAGFVTAVNNLRDLVGTTATLTGTDINSGTITCTARCDGVPLVVTPSAMSGPARWMRITLVFRPTTKWV